MTDTLLQPSADATPAEPLTPAQRLYGSDTPSAAAPIDVPGNIQTLRDSTPTSPAEKLYGSTPHPAALQLVKTSNPLQTPAEQTALALEISRMGKDMGLDDADLGELINRAPLARQVAPEKVNQQHAEAMRLLRDAFGSKADQALADAKRLASRDPRMATLLTQTGLGNDPQTVLLLARKAQTQRGMGRL